jgi:hypothetical protein
MARHQAWHRFSILAAALIARTPGGGKSLDRLVDEITASGGTAAKALIWMYATLISCGNYSKRYR